MPEQKFDQFDHKLLQLLQEDSSRTLEFLGDTVGLSSSAVQRRIKRYKKSGLILKEVTILNGKQLPRYILATALVTFERETPALHQAFQKKMRNTPEVQQCYDLAGSNDYLIIITASSLDRYTELIEYLFISDPNIKRYDTFFIFETIKTGLSIPTFN